jgi:endoglucanase
MEKSREEFLKKLIETPSPSGFEEQVQKIFREVQDKVDLFYKDYHGNAIGVIHPDSSFPGYVGRSL